MKGAEVVVVKITDSKAMNKRLGTVLFLKKLKTD